jgi:spore germination protein YaaH
MEIGSVVEPVAQPRRLSLPGASLKRWVYGYLPYWSSNLNTVAWDSLTHVAFFDVGVDSSGALTSTDRWTSVSSKLLKRAEKYGVKVHLTVTCFDAAVMEAVLNNPSKRRKLVNALASLVNEAGAHGVSVDFEGVPFSVKKGLVSLVEELSEEVDEVTVATPAIDWNGSFDYDALAAASDALFIMGYGYHWSGGDPGPISPLQGGGIWGKYSLSWSVQDHMEWGAPAERILLGLPLYGRNWPSTSTSVPGTATADGEAVVYREAVPAGESIGRNYDVQTDTPYAFPSSKHQLWYDDLQSLRAKVRYAVEQDLLGVGFWALNYDGGDEALWEMVQEEVGLWDPEQDSGLADSGGSPQGGEDTGLDPNKSDPSLGCGCSGLSPSSTPHVSAWVLAGILLRRRRRRD